MNQSKKIRIRNRAKTKNGKHKSYLKNTRKKIGGANKKERQEELKYNYSQLLKQILNKHNKKKQSRI